VCDRRPARVGGRGYLSARWRKAMRARDTWAVRQHVVLVSAEGLCAVDAARCVGEVVDDFVEVDLDVALVLATGCGVRVACGRIGSEADVVAGAHRVDRRVDAGGGELPGCGVAL